MENPATALFEVGCHKPYLVCSAEFCCRTAARIELFPLGLDFQSQAVGSFYLTFAKSGFHKGLLSWLSKQLDLVWHLLGLTPLLDGFTKRWNVGKSPINPKGPSSNRLPVTRCHPLLLNSFELFWSIRRKGKTKAAMSWCSCWRKWGQIIRCRIHTLFQFLKLKKLPTPKRFLNQTLAGVRFPSLSRDGFLSVFDELGLRKSPKCLFHWDSALLI